MEKLKFILTSIMILTGSVAAADNNLIIFLNRDNFWELGQLVEIQNRRRLIYPVKVEDQTCKVISISNFEVTCGPDELSTRNETLGTAEPSTYSETARALDRIGPRFPKFSRFSLNTIHFKLSYREETRSLEVIRNNPY